MRKAECLNCGHKHFISKERTKSEWRCMVKGCGCLRFKPA